MNAAQSRLALVLIAADIAILTVDEARSALLKALAEDPAVIAKVMDKHNPMSDGDSRLYDVVVESHGGNKIQLIKLFRELSGYGLSESKAWSEGVTQGTYRGGVFKSGCVRSQPEKYMKDIHDMSTRNGYPIHAKLIKAGAPFTYPGWNTYGNNPAGVITIAKVSDGIPVAKSEVNHGETPLHNVAGG